MRILQHTFFMLTVALTVAQNAAGADAKMFDAGGGIAAVDEGDDRSRPALFAHFGWAEFNAARVYSYGRKFGPVKETTYIGEYFRRIPMFGTEFLSAAVGGCFMVERTELNFTRSKKSEETSTNLGGLVGLHLNTRRLYPIYAELAWDSHLFLAGVNGGLLIATGRKQTISLGLGISL